MFSRGAVIVISLRRNTEISNHQEAVTIADDIVTAIGETIKEDRLAVAAPSSIATRAHAEMTLPQNNTRRNADSKSSLFSHDVSSDR
jgi:hypothetical protein